MMNIVTGQRNFLYVSFSYFNFYQKQRKLKTLGKQLLRSGCSVGANFRSACRARSKAEYISKVGIALEEADESSFWMELLIESGIMPESKLKSLYDESVELTKVFAVTKKPQF